MAQRPQEQGALVAESGVEATAPHPHAGHKILHRRRVIAARPERLHRAFQRRRLVKGFLPRHRASPLSHLTLSGTIIQVTVAASRTSASPSWTGAAARATEGFARARDAITLPP
jgi:hypothetical protein